MRRSVGRLLHACSPESESPPNTLGRTRLAGKHSGAEREQCGVGWTEARGSPQVLVTFYYSLVTSAEELLSIFSVCPFKSNTHPAVFTLKIASGKHSSGDRFHVPMQPSTFKAVTWWWGKSLNHSHSSFILILTCASKNSIVTFSEREILSISKYNLV